MKFSKRLELGKEVDKFIKDNHIAMGGLGVLSTLEIMGWEVVRKDELKKLNEMEIDKDREYENHL